MNKEPLIEVHHLSKHFPVFRGMVFKRKIGVLKAVDDISFQIFPGETLGLVGESGCGKTTACRVVLQLEPSTAGEVRFQGETITQMAKQELRRLRKRMQIIFQDPFGSLNPRMRVRDIVGEPLSIHGLARGKSEYADRVSGILELVGLNPSMADRYPHEFSGGQRQRIGIARALVLNPDFLVCDEPVSALDVSIQAQIINLLAELQERLGLTYLFVAHDLAVVRHISHRVAVMYLGEIVEIADRDELYLRPQHPYTKALLSAVPIPDPLIEQKRKHCIISGEVPSLMETPKGCKFHPRCPIAEEVCRNLRPTLKEINGNGHRVACHLV